METMFRCPTCAKTWKLLMTDGEDVYAFISSKKANKFYITKEPIDITNEWIEIKNWNELEDFMLSHCMRFVERIEKNKYIPSENDNAVCVYCGEVHDIETWNDAFLIPEDFFDMDDICACGGEILYMLNPYTKLYELCCEKCKEPYNTPLARGK